MPKPQASRRRPLTRKPAGPVKKLPHEVAGLKLEHYEFCLAFLSSSYNASAAYKAAYPGVTDGTARSNGYRLLTNADIKAFLAAHIEERWKPWEMSADEASARVAMDARADVRLLLDEKGDLLPPSQWPDEIANSIESIDVSRGKVKLTSKAQARRTVLELTGRLKGSTDGLRDLADILAEKFKG